MCDQTNVENINDTSETESEEWDLIQHKDAQISENTSDAESVEIINEEEAAVRPHCEDISSNNRDANDSIAFPNENVVEKSNCDTFPKGEPSKSDEVESSESSSDVTYAAYTNGDLFSRYFPISERINSVLSEPRDAISVCLAIFFVGLAMLIASEDGIFYKNSTSLQNDQGIDIAALLKELQLYRESNEHLKQQVKDLSEVVSGLQKSAYESPIKEDVRQDSNQKSSQIPPVKQTLPHVDDSFGSLIELINFYKDFPFLHNDSLFYNNTSNRFLNSTMNEVFTSLYNESVLTTLELFYKIPSHLKRLTTVVSQHGNVEPFISKWGQKLNKFSKSMDNDIKKIKLKFAKHLLKNLNELMHSFYRKLCKFEINKVITVQECDTHNFERSWIKNRENSKKSVINKESLEKVWKNQERFIYDSNKKDKNYFRQYKYFGKKKRLDAIQDEPDDTINEIIADDSSEEFDNKFTEKKIEEIYEEVNGKIINEGVNIILPDKREPLKKMSENKDNFVRTMDSKVDQSNNGRNRKRRMYGLNNLEQVNSRRFHVDSYLCKKGYLSRCNTTDRSIDSNWFLDMGNQRSKIRTHQSKGDWLFDRARARREKITNENHKQYYRKHTVPPPI